MKAIADFDVLSEEQPLKTIVEALGIKWEAVQPDWKLVKAAVDGKKPDLGAKEVIKEIETILSSISEPTFPPKAKSDIQSVLKRTSSWAHAKGTGKPFVPSGDPSKACDRLLSSLRAGGLHVVEVGEFEGYVRSEGGHGPKGVNEVLKRHLATDPELAAARKFVLDLVDGSLLDEKAPV